MPLIPGSRLGVYEVIAPIGAGGMGEVYRARDTKLQRDVAIKVLPDLFAADSERLARFAREARTLAALNHPHIAQIYGVEGHALVMELVAGEDLAERLSRSGRIPLEDALPIALQIAEALEAAHELGIIHRDLKPANIKVRPDGTVKVLDFGLAKALGPPGALDGTVVADSPTITGAGMSSPGAIMGTVAYMSPEQARGLPLDRRTDIWAFGCVLYEMLTARRPFTGATMSDVAAAVLTGEPDWVALPETTSPVVRKLLRRCLQKDRKRRLADAADVRLEIEEALAFPNADAGAAPAARASHVARLAIPLALASVALAGALLVWAVTRSAPQASARPARFAIVPPPAQALAISGAAREVALSPDGTSLVYTAAGGRLMVRPFDRLDAIPMAGITNASAPFLSPDGRWIGFFTGTSGELKKVSITGGLPITLCRTVGTPRGASWGSDDTIVFATNEPTTGLFRVRADGGTPEVLTTTDATKGMEGDHLFPSVLPDGRAVLFTIAGVSSNAGNAQVAILDVTTGQRKTLIRGGSQAEYVNTGHLIYAVAGSLRAVRFDVATREVLGDSVPVVEPFMAAATGAANFSVARNGTLVYAIGGAGSQSTGTRSLVWVTRQGREEPIAAPARAYVYPGISPDGTRVALSIDDQERDIWTWDFARARLTRLTFDPGRDSYPGWTPDGRHILFTSTRAGVFNLYSRPADGSGADERLTHASQSQFGSPSSTPDGTRVVFTEVVPGTGEDLRWLSLDPSTGRGVGAAQSEPLLQTSFAERNPQISPDGHWLAYESNESGQEEVFVRPFPKVGDGRWQVSTGGGTVPRWARSGRELFYRAGNSLMAAAVETTPTFASGTATKLFEGYVTGLGRSYDVSRDGQRFLMIKDNAASQQAAPVASLVVVLNWFEELKAKLPGQK